MPSLRELESSFGSAMLGEREAALLDLIAADGLTSDARLRIYRNDWRCALDAAADIDWVER